MRRSFTGNLEAFVSLRPGLTDMIVNFSSSISNHFCLAFPYSPLNLAILLPLADSNLLGNHSWLSHSTRNAHVHEIVSNARYSKDGAAIVGLWQMRDLG